MNLISRHTPCQDVLKIISYVYSNCFLYIAFTKTGNVGRKQDIR